MIETTTYSEKSGGYWIPGALILDDRCAAWPEQPYAKLHRWPFQGGRQWAALVHFRGHTIRFVTESMSARQVFRWTSARLREAITGGKDGTSCLHQAVLKRAAKSK